MIVLSGILTVLMVLLKRSTVYGAVSLGIALLMVLFLFDGLVGIRLGIEELPHSGFDLSAELRRMIHGKRGVRYLMLFNAAGFAPLGFFFSEYLTETKRFTVKRKLALVALIAFGLSLCIESLQLIFQLGWFEMTDMVMNLFGALVGVGISLAMHTRRQNA